MRKGAVSAFDGGLDVGGARGGDFAEDFLRSRIGLGEETTVTATPELAIDKKLSREAQGRVHVFEEQPGVNVERSTFKVRSSKFKIWAKQAHAGLYSTNRRATLPSRISQTK